MAVTGAIFNSLTFGGVNSADYGIYITGEAVFNAPERAVEMVEVPGRNGAIALDQGRWENIEVEYPAGTFGMNEEEFRTALSNFRNAIVSQIGYQRLTDTYHPDEYRMAMYVSGFDVSPKHYNSAGEFKLTFNCKPQRWLANGDAAITVASGDTLYNPTQYDASPLLMVEGYGNINLNEYEIDIENALMGNVEVLPSKSAGLYDLTTRYIRPSQRMVFNTGDSLTLEASTLVFELYTSMAETEFFFSSLVSINDSNSGFLTSFKQQPSYGRVTFETSISPITWVAGTDGETTDTITIVMRMWDNTTKTFEVVLEVFYDAENSSGNSAVAIIIKSSTLPTHYYERRYQYSLLGAIVADSTVSILGHPTYIDCDLGDVYLIKDGQYVSLNKFVDLGSDLPVLKPGINEITFDDTITGLKAKPNWWIL